MFASSATIVDLWQSHADGDTLEIYPTDSPSHVAGLSDGDPGAEEDPVPFLNRTGTAANGTINGRERLVPGDRQLWMDASSADGECLNVIFEAGDYCQIVSRTRKVQFSPEGYPLLLNFLNGERGTGRNGTHGATGPRTANAAIVGAAAPGRIRWMGRGG